MNTANSGRSLTIAWAGVAVGAAGLVASLAAFWGANPGHADRLLVLAGAAWAAWELRPAIASAPRRPRPKLGLALVGVAAVAAPAAWYLQTRVGPRPVGLWWQAGCCLAAAAGLLLLRDGWPRLRAVAFPIGFVLFALPIPGKVMSPLQSGLQEFTTAAAHAVLGACGIAFERTGFVLRLPGGDLGVAEACSCVRSVTAITAIAAFVAYLRGYGPGRGVLLVGLAVPVVAVVNVVRVVLSGAIQEWAGADYVRGDWHEALGVAMVLVGLGLVLGIASWFGEPREPGEVPTSGEPTNFPAKAWPGRVAAAVMVAGVAGSVVAGLGGSAAESRAAVAAPLGDIGLTLGPWRGTEQPVPAYVAETLGFDAAVYRVYANNVGRAGHVWVVFWDRYTATGPHDPDVCWPRRGFAVAGRRKEPVPFPGGGPTATVRDYQRGPDREQLVYWIQDGRDIVADPDAPPDEKDLFRHRAGHGWAATVLGLSEADTHRPRLMVLVAVPQGGAAARADALALAAAVAGDLYRVCPWADPRAGQIPDGVSEKRE